MVNNMKVVLMNAYSFCNEERNNVKEVNRIIGNDIEIVYQDGSIEEIDATSWSLNEVHPE
jgi:hypothetical protein